MDDFHQTAEKHKFDFFQSLNHVDVNLNPWFLTKRGYYIVPSPSTALSLVILVFPWRIGMLRSKACNMVKNCVSEISISGYPISGKHNSVFFVQFDYIILGFT